ncbi:hypothetical protein PF1068 [Pyrococcus furiosus DSM 3638]|uniref:Uncharacterized protein n=1 Tax=Pyrococcus furiosus (strain ATCC 43587 / DSM 3638 / JCM 8422 / Vc1) TaxID=186497 RepID=Q8U1Y6_PYRFU|nr:hypothetical protein PF1068 [Pyrococcus furiosus DSM 3638]
MIFSLSIFVEDRSINIRKPTISMGEYLSVSYSIHVIYGIHKVH